MANEERVPLFYSLLNLNTGIICFAAVMYFPTQGVPTRYKCSGESEDYSPLESVAEIYPPR